MKVQNMSEPISGTAVGVAGWKIIGGLAGMGAIGAGLAAFVVMSMTKPKDETEWRVALASTLVGSIGSGAALVRYLGIQKWVEDPVGLVAMLAVVFTCGLLAWAFVRALFAYLNKRKDADLMEIVKEAKEVIDGARRHETVRGLPRVGAQCRGLSPAGLPVPGRDPDDRCWPHPRSEARRPLLRPAGRPMAYAGLGGSRPGGRDACQGAPQSGPIRRVDVVRV
jgi:hypothetical protein